MQGSALGAAIEGAVYLGMTGLGVLACSLGLMGVRGAVWLTLLLVGGLFLLSWKRFDGGRHPCFLFLGLILVFQCGRLFGYITGFLDDPFRIEVQSPMPFDIGPIYSEITLLCIILSALFIYLPCRWRYEARLYEGKDGWARWLPYAYAFFALLTPFTAYKNYQYLRYIQSHGGYFVLYMDPEGVFESAGSIVRVLSLLGSQVFMFIYLMERRPIRLFVVTGIFIALSVMELLTGFRGKVFIEILVLWYIYNLKHGKRFRMLPVISAGLLLTAVGLLVAGFREQRTIESLGPIGFLSVQGVSLNVTECAIAFQDIFSPHAFSYLLHGLGESFVAVTTLPEGSIFANDLSIFLSAEAYRLGGGTGSTYLAEAYVLGGMPMVVISSLLVGLVLSWVHRQSSSFAGALLLVCALPSLIYLPRSGLVAPFSATLKNLIPILFMLCIFFLVRAAGRLLLPTHTTPSELPGHPERV